MSKGSWSRVKDHAAFRRNYDRLFGADPSRRAAGADPDFPHSFICCTCAHNRGGQWPLDHVATMHRDICPYCGRDDTLTNVGDWDWPDGRARGMRD